MHKLSGVQARFLLGPAGSGKTFRCLGEIRSALRSSPDGLPLVLLAPKQATFQLERRLLAQAEISGFTRLHIFSFDKLARFVFEQLNLAPPKMLSCEGRVMVLRALLMRHEHELKLFGRSARRPGFAVELGALLSELQQHRFTPAKLRALAGTNKPRLELQNKLLDLALLHEKYSDWLAGHDLLDADCLLDFSTSALRDKSKTGKWKLGIENLWLDGFAEMTPQELDFLAAVLAICERATLAFCLENEHAAGPARLSIWSAIGKTFQQCRSRLANLPGCIIEIETLPRDPQKNRFAENPTLQQLEENWAQRVPNKAARVTHPAPVVRAVVCADPEAEAVFAAREILKFVRPDQSNRFRDCAVLVRKLDGYHQALARVFRRFEIPFFLDRREAVAHHPLAELTRSALRTVTFDWQPGDWFAALKAGFSPVAETEIDQLENAALEFGWRGKKWREPFADEFFREILSKVIPPFEKLFTHLAQINFKPNGGQLAGLIRGLWGDLKVGRVLEEWPFDGEKSEIHSTVFNQMNSWLDSLALAFPRGPLHLRDWLPILEAGLANLTVGVIPPALDQVLIGAIDRARNPDLKFTLVLGVNDTIFPASPNSPAILTNADRSELENQNARLGANLFDQISRERYLGYIACTRASEKLAMTFSRQGADGKTLGSSPFIAQLQNIFPALEVEEFSGEPGWRSAQHAHEMVPMVLQSRAGVPPAPVVDSIGLPVPPRSQDRRDACLALLKIPGLKSLAEKLAQLREPDMRENLSPAMAGNIYSATLRSSVSRLEEFAQCPFKFFVRSGLRAGERKAFELDARERGNFQHDVLNMFHGQLQAEGKRWRDLTPAAARARVGKIAEAAMEHFRDGLLRDSAESIFAARAMAASLQDFVEVIVSWMHSQYDFDPVAAELGFGSKDSGVPPWEIDLGDGHKLALQGRIDRVDLWREPGGEAALAIVTDYKSGGKKLDSLLVENGVQLQLLAYLGALRRWQNPQKLFCAGKLVPVGAFYVNLRGEFKGGGTRDEILGDAGAKQRAYRHHGRFDAGTLRKFDRRANVTAGDQFNFRLNKDGQVPSNSAEALPRENFNALLDGVETKLRKLGKNIFSGAAQVDPYRNGKQTPCEFCGYRAGCRIDKWTHEWRVLRAGERKEKQ